MSQVRPWAVSLLCLTLAACQQSVMVRPANDGRTPSTRPAPVSRSSVPTHTVATGDTLYKISMQYGLDYRDIAAWNEIASPYTIYPKQVLKLGPPGNAPAAPQSTGTSVVAAVPDTPANRPQTTSPQTASAPATSTAAGTAAAPGFDSNLGVTLPEGARPLSGSSAQASAAAPPSTTPPRSGPAAGTSGAPRADLPSVDQLEAAPPPSPATTAALSESGVPGPARTQAPPASAATSPPAAGAATDVVSDKPSAAGWIWPTTGKVVATYASGDPTRQGVDVAGSAGQPVRAARDGEVVYSGAGLIGYGELIIIKHSPELLSAYGHNRIRLVKEGQKVKAGQKIAEMGRSPANRDLLHFEIRRNGKPVDPLPLLPSR